MKRKNKSVYKKNRSDWRNKYFFLLYAGLFLLFLLAGLITGKQITEAKKIQLLSEQKKFETQTLNKLKEKFSVKTVYTSVHD